MELKLIDLFVGTIIEREIVHLYLRYIFYLGNLKFYVYVKYLLLLELLYVRGKFIFRIVSCFQDTLLFEINTKDECVLFWRLTRTNCIRAKLRVIISSNFIEATRKR